MKNFGGGYEKYGNRKRKKKRKDEKRGGGNIIKNIVFVLCIGMIMLGSSILAGCSCSLFPPDSNTRETAELLTPGERVNKRMDRGGDYWLYFELDDTEDVAFAYDDDPHSVAYYFYTESEAAVAPLILLSEDPDGTDSDPIEENRLMCNGFETRTLSAGRYYLRLHGLEGAFSAFNAGVMFLIVSNLPALPIGTTQIAYSSTGSVQLASGFYTLDLTEERSDFTADAVMPEYISHRIYFYYGENNAIINSFYFSNSQGENGVSSSTVTLPAGRTIVQVSTYVNDSRVGPQPDATVKYTAAKAVSGTVFDREVSALPALPLGEELNLSEMFELEIGFTGVMLHGLNSMHINLTEDSLLSVRVKGYPDSSSLTVHGYYNTNPLNSVKRLSGTALFSALEHHDDKILSFKLPAGLNLIELRVNLAIDYSLEVFASSTIEFDILPIAK